MSKSSGRPPPAPDYVAAAQEQGRLNLDAARTGAELNRVNQVGPDGSTIYSRDGDQYTQTTTLSPEQQALYDQSVRNAQDRAGLAGQSAGYLGQQLSNPIDFGGLVGRTSSVNNSPYQTNVNADSVAQRNVDLSGVPGINTDFSGERQRVEDSLYGSGAARLDDQFGRREENTRTQLLNQGIREGSEAWNNAMNDFGNERQDAYGNLRDRSIAAGGAEQSRLFADALQARQQGVGEQFGTAGFANDAAQQNFGNEAYRTNLYNSGQDTNFNQGLVNANLGNQARDAGINETLLPRQQIMSEFQNLYGDPYSYQAPGVPGVAGPAPVDYTGAVNQQYQGQVDQYNAQQQARGGLYGALAGLGGNLGSAAILASDPRLKSDIERIGKLPNGLPTYRFKYKGEDQSRMGVMSTDVREFMPGAVVVGEDGYDRVNYSMIGATHLLEVN